MLNPTGATPLAGLKVIDCATLFAGPMIALMLGDFGEVYVMDWGLAKALGRTPQANGQEGQHRPPKPTNLMVR